MKKNEKNKKIGAVNMGTMKENFKGNIYKKEKLEEMYELEKIDYGKDDEIRTAYKMKIKEHGIDIMLLELYEGYPEKGLIFLKMFYQEIEIERWKYNSEEYEFKDEINDIQNVLNEAKQYPNVLFAKVEGGYTGIKKIILKEEAEAELELLMIEKEEGLKMYYDKTRKKILLQKSPTGLETRQRAMKGVEEEIIVNRKIGNEVYREKNLDFNKEKKIECIPYHKKFNFLAYEKIDPVIEVDRKKTLWEMIYEEVEEPKNKEEMLQMIKKQEYPITIANLEIYSYKMFMDKKRKPEEGKIYWINSISKIDTRKYFIHNGKTGKWMGEEIVYEGIEKSSNFKEPYEKAQATIDMLKEPYYMENPKYINQMVMFGHQKMGVRFGKVVQETEKYLFLELEETNYDIDNITKNPKKRSKLYGVGLMMNQKSLVILQKGIGIRSVIGEKKYKEVKERKIVDEDLVKEITELFFYSEKTSDKKLKEENIKKIIDIALERKGEERVIGDLANMVGDSSVTWTNTRLNLNKAKVIQMIKEWLG